MKDTVVYTSIMGGYDTLENPSFIEEGVDYACITDTPEITAGTIWKPLYCEATDPVVDNRHHKMLPYLFFSDYKRSLYIDGRVDIRKAILPLMDSCLKQSNFAISRHPSRDCLYKEAEVCNRKWPANKRLTLLQTAKYKKEGYPAKSGLWAGWVIARNHNEKDVLETMELWIKEYMKYGRRDQVSLPYVIWKKRLSVSQIPGTIFKEIFKIGSHKK